MNFPLSLNFNPLLHLPIIKHFHFSNSSNTTTNSSLSTFNPSLLAPTRYTDRDYSNEDGEHVQHMPKFFAKSGFADADPKKIKKEGGGKGNWGHPGEEVVDTAYNPTNPRRRSNSSGHSKSAKDFKTKFEVVEHEPVFEDMPPEEEDEEHVKLEHQSTTSSTETVDGSHD
ncbi:hypothetical protein BT63DRAFT_409725 [Microthyrium microscopicum]|uniref:Hyaluronan/mRNA-binding protein domain-containing protein n=1 Tax=Microthyrium microscopicum TaxID=703497 RepID=A0A6A6UM87_9PEZI|nr:hypothetical protein BT63DRAFT_409725 [Microthyrium microscopicum]